MADNLTTFMCRLSRNLGASTSWNPVGLSRPVTALLYLIFYKSKNRRPTAKPGHYSTLHGYIAIVFTVIHKINKRIYQIIIK
jgi:hypothetical protein